MKKNLILDLDETLISSLHFSKFDKTKHYSLLNDKTLSYHFMHNCENGKCTDFSCDGYIVFERPFLQTFLSHVFKKYNVSVWTAASKPYGLFIIKNILLVKPNRCLHYFFHSLQCEQSTKETASPKSIQFLVDKYKLSVFQQDTTIVDDLEIVKKTQPDRCIRVKAFQYESVVDQDLLRVMKELK